MKTTKRRKGFRDVVMGVVLGGITVIGGILFAYDQGHFSEVLANDHVYEKPEVVVEEVSVPEIEVLIKEAQDAASAEIEIEAEELKQNHITERHLEIEIEVRDLYIAEQEAINLEKKEQTKVY